MAPVVEIPPNLERREGRGMSILIKGMEMPKVGDWKTIRIYYDGTCAVPNWQGDCKYMQGCEAVPIPPHGRLIDADALWVEINKICDRRDAEIISDLTCLQQILSAVRHAPTIIEAEDNNGADGE